MLFFPQLSSGASGQYPLVRRTRARTIVSAIPDGSSVKLSDSGGSSMLWELHVSALSTAEWTAIETLFTAAQGRLQNFTFLDPADNLLRRSEDFTSAVWAVDPLLVTTPGISDPLGTHRASRLTNTGQAMQGISQSVAAPGGYQYCFSAYLRAAVPTQATLVRSTLTASQSQTVAVTSNWTRFISAGALASLDTAISVAIQLAAGASVEVFGLQLEPQPAPSIYRRTLDQGGVYPKARFAQDTLTRTTNADEQNSAVVQVFSFIGTL